MTEIPKSRIDKVVAITHAGIESSRTILDRTASVGKEVDTKLGRSHKIYCLSCGVYGGTATITTTEIHYICDECFEKYGGLPLPQIPDEEVKEIIFGR